MNYNEFADPIKHNKVLNPHLWDNDNLKPEIKQALLKIAKDFKIFIDVPFKVVDVIIAGGNANYTYTDKSDIDLHLIADFSSVDCDREAAELFDSKRLLYKQKYNVTIHGIPVELYVEDLRQPAVSSSYSLLTDQWINPPNPEIPDYDQAELDKMVKVWRKVIQHAIQTGDLQTCRNALKLLRTYRKLGLKTSDGEYSIPNLVYKSLRNDQEIEGIQTLVDKLHDKQLSV
jgi:hypothetical protein